MLCTGGEANVTPTFAPSASFPTKGASAFSGRELSREMNEYLADGAKDFVLKTVSMRRYYYHPEEDDLFFSLLPNRRTYHS